MKTMPPEPASRPRLNRVILWIAGVIIVVIVIFVALWFTAASNPSIQSTPIGRFFNILSSSVGQNQPAQQPQTAFPGSLVLQVYAQWQTPHGVVFGSTLYTPSSQKIVSLVPPGTSILPLSFSSDGKTYLALQVSKDSVNLDRVQVSSDTPTVVESAPVGSMFINPIWSPDNSRIAYYFSPSLNNLPLAPDGKPYFVTEGATSTLRTGLTLPAAFTSHLVISHADGTSAVNAKGIPVLFSPDGQQLLAESSQGYAIVSSADGSQSAAKGVTVTTKGATSVVTSQDGLHFAVVGGSATTVYAVNWQNDTISAVGTLPGATEAAFDGGQLLLIQGNNASIYTLSNNALKLTAAYTVSLPEQVQIIAWLAS